MTQGRDRVSPAPHTPSPCGAVGCSSPGLALPSEPLPATRAHHHRRQGRSHPPLHAGEPATVPRMGPGELECSGIASQQRGPAHGPGQAEVAPHRGIHVTMAAKQPKVLSPNKEPRAKGLGSSGSPTRVLGCPPSVSSPQELKPPSTAPAEEMGTGRVANTDENRAATPGHLGRLSSWAYPNKPQLDAARRREASRPAGGQHICCGRGIPDSRQDEGVWSHTAPVTAMPWSTGHAARARRQLAPRQPLA